MCYENWQLNIKVEFMACDTPQQNSIAEVAIVTAMNSARAMMHCANLPIEIRYCMWHEVCKTATILDGLIVLLHSGTVVRQLHGTNLFGGRTPHFVRIWMCGVRLELSKLKWVQPQTSR